MKTKITLLVLTALLGLTNVFANSMPGSENNVENEIMTTGDNSIIISAGKRIYTLDMNTYQATLLATSPYVNEINSIASDNTTGWIFYVSNHISTYNWTIYGYNVYTNTHKNFGSVRHFFTSTGHAYSSRGLGSGGATFYNGKLYFAMEYPAYCYYYRGNTTANQNPKDELPNNVRSAGTVSNTMFTNERTTTSYSMEDEPVDDGARGTGETPADFEIIDADEANVLNDLVSDYIPEEDLPADETADGGLAQRGNSNAESYYTSSSYNNYIYLLEISFSGLSDASGSTASVSNGTPVYDNWGYSSFLYRGELGDIVVDDNGQLYAATSYQVQAFNFGSKRYDWANNEDVYAQMAKDKHSALQLLKNTRQCSTYYYNGCPHTSCTIKSFVQTYTAPSSLRTYNSLQLGNLNEITGLNSYDVGRITDASDYIRLTPPVSYKIKGFVFDDNDENGSFNSTQGETKLSGIEVTLYADNNEDGVLDAGDTVIESQNTNATGHYTFNDVQVEKTLVKVTVPSNDTNFTYTLTTPQTVSVTGATTDITGIKFGINKAEVINVAYDIFGTVYDDNNENAILEAGENGLDAVTLTLYADNNTDGILDAGDTVITTTTSGTDGSYSFLHVCIQNTIVALTVPSNNGTYTYTLTTPATQAIDSINTNVTGVDFGVNEKEVIDFNISGTVFDDNNENGTTDAGEAGLNGVTITLYADNNADGILDVADTAISTTTTGVDGTYSFSNIITPNVLAVITTPGNTATFTYVLTTSGTQAASSTITDVTGLDFGVNEEEVILYNISGNVFDDNNGNGVRDAGEGFIGATVVTLYADTNNDGLLDAGDTVINTTTTSTMSGNYSFTGVTVRNTIAVVSVPGDTATFTYVPTTSTERAISSTITNVPNVNYGIDRLQVVNYNISGTVFDDDNENGLIDTAEAGRLENVTLTLYADNDNNGTVDAGDTVINTTTSDVNGAYTFNNVTVQQTLVVVTEPSNTPDFNYVLTTSSVQVINSTITAVTNVDFGINQTSTTYAITGNVFNDVNADGNNAGDGGLTGVTVRLYADTNQNGRVDRNEPIIATTTSDRDGNYQFTGLSDIFVVVQVIVPANTSQFQYTSTTPVNVALNSGTTATVNFGIARTAVILYSVTGIVWDDADADQIKDATESRLEGVGVTLYNDVNENGTIDAGDVALSTVLSSVTGSYEFTNINIRYVIVAATIPSNGVLTTPAARAVSSINTNAIDIDFGINIEETLFEITGVVFDDDNENGVIDAGEGSLDGLTVEVYADTDLNGLFDPNLDQLIAFTQTNNAGFELINPNYLIESIGIGQVHIVIVIPPDTTFTSYRPTFDPDSGTSNPDGVFTTFMTASLFQINFGINFTDQNATSRAANTDDVLFTNGSVAEDVSERLRLYPNPTVRQIAINSEEFIGNVTVEIYNDRGYKVMTSTASPIGDEFKVDVERLAPGMYYAKFSSNNKVASKKFIKK